MRSVFFIPDPFASRRVPIAELVQEEGDRVVMRRLSLPDWLAPEQVAAIVCARSDIEQRPSLEALPSSVGPQVVLGDLVRVFYPDGTSEDLDERTASFDLSVETDRVEEMPPGTPVSELVEDFGRGAPVQVVVRFNDGQWDHVWSLPVDHLGERRGSNSLWVSLAPGRWAKVRVESWEQEARRLRQGIANLAYRFERAMGGKLAAAAAVEVRKVIQTNPRSAR